MPSEFPLILARLRKGDIAVTTLSVPTDGREVDSLRCWLSNEERHRADQFRFERDRAAYVGAHALLSALVSDLLGKRGIAWELHCARRGMKPYICSKEAPSLSVNLSHTEGLAAVVVGVGCEVGIDVERVHDVAMSIEEMLDLLTLRERALLQDGPARNRSFLRFWTRKEACLKAFGVGLSIAPEHVDTSDSTQFLIRDMASQVWGMDFGVDREWVGCVSAIARPTTIHVAQVRLLPSTIQDDAAALKWIEKLRIDANSMPDLWQCWDLRDAEGRHAAQEKRMLADVDRARQASKQLEAGLAKEEQRRLRGEEAAAQLLDAERRALRGMHNRSRSKPNANCVTNFAAQAVELAQAQSHGVALQQRVDDLQQRFGEEKKGHAEARALLAGRAQDA